MNINEPPDPRSSLWGAMAYFLRFQRMEKGQSGYALAEMLNCARSSVSRLENGEAKLTPQQADTIDEAWRTGGLFGVLLYYAARASDPDWFKTFEALESRASVIHSFSGQLVPALFQTPAYARALLVAGRAADVEGAVEARMSRQSILKRGEPPELWVLLAESVIDWPVGGPVVMREQLARLLELSELPHVTLRVVPRSAGAYLGLDGPFKVITVREGPAGFIEAPHAGRLVSDAAEVSRLRTGFDRIGADALPVDSTRNLIRRHMEKMT
ncbi:helix-turn-helix transcriptional regulator [Spirillospora sp. NPDC047279]|uniref:helix-turn-helix domain-containing protein n=1 Tax=Spirillospora sp. NPDC047279 TaxID=3155478 RepID=UPI0033EBD459